jgi:hypothetical protein
VVWMDIRSIPTGSNWDLEVQKALDTSDMMLVLLSPSAVGSQNVADEWSYFIEKNKGIVPLLVEPCEVPFRLSRRQRVDFTADYRKGFQQLIKALGSPNLVDPDSTQKIRPVVFDKPKPAPVENPPARQPAAPVVITAPKAAKPAPGVAPEVGVKMYPIIWSDHYHWFTGMGSHAAQGDIMIDSHEIKLVPHAQPIITIPIRSLVSAVTQRSVDHHLKLTYYGPTGDFRSLVVMGAPKPRRREITEQVLNLLKLVTGRSLA